MRGAARAGRPPPAAMLILESCPRLGLFLHPFPCSARRANHQWRAPATASQLFTARLSLDWAPASSAPRWNSDESCGVCLYRLMRPNIAQSSEKPPPTMPRMNPSYHLIVSSPLIRAAAAFFFNFFFHFKFDAIHKNENNDRTRSRETTKAATDSTSGAPHPSIVIIYTKPTPISSDLYLRS